MKIGAIIQARTGSTRLPEKVMKKIQGKTVLEHVVERVEQSKLINEIIIATTINKNDSLIVDEAKHIGVKYYRGSEDDVLSRYYFAAKAFKLDIIIRITSDCPLIDSNIIDGLLNYYMSHEVNIVTNCGSKVTERTYPRGLDTEIFPFELLEDAYLNAKELYQREHVTPYLYQNSDSIYYYKNNSDYSHYRWTLDTEEDFILISEIYQHLYKGKHDFYLDDIINLFIEKPELFNINAHIKQKETK